MFRTTDGWGAYTPTGDVVEVGQPNWSREQAREELGRQPAGDLQWKKGGASGLSVTMNVSHRCNLKCRYCYADGGSYGTGEGLMSPEVAALTVRRFMGLEGPPLREVKFFGGEPLLNLQAIRTALRELETLCRERRRPKIGIVTNGTLVTDEFVELCQEYGIVVTVSLDGERTAHDQLRPFADGRGSYGAVMRGIEKLCAGLPQATLRYESTFTALHQRLGMSRVDVARHASALGVPIGFAYCYMGTDPDLLCTKSVGEDEAFLSYVLDGVLRPEPFTDFDLVRLLGALVSRRYSDDICPVGSRVFLITPQGDIYPCNLFVFPRFRMGSILDPDWRSRPRFREVQAALRPATDRSTSARCGRCWAYHMCTGCPASVFRETGELTMPPPSECRSKRWSMEHTLRWLIATAKDPLKWQRLEVNLRKICLLEE